MAKKVYFVRHGETAGNAEGHFQFPHTPLSENGHKGAQAVALRFKHVAIDEIIASPFTRAQETAEHISAVTQKAITTFEELHERFQPLSIRGKMIASEEGQRYLEQYSALFRSSEVEMEGFENFYAVLKRVERCISMLEENPSQNIVVVSHGAFLRSVTAYLLLDKNTDMETNMAVEGSLRTMSNVGITEFVYEDNKWRLFTWNDHAHFAE